MKHIFVINPNAGNRKYKEIIDFLKNQTKYDFNYKILLTNKCGEVEEYLKHGIANEKIRMYAVGGDGTLCNLVNSVVNKNISIGVIPVGTGNDFAYEIYKTRIYNYEDLIISLINGIEKKIDLGKLNDRYFINISSIGFDSNVVLKAQQLKNNTFYPSKFSYMGGIFYELLDKKGLYLNINIDGETTEGKFLLIAIANCRYYGRGILPAPDAKFDDGLLDICIIKDLSKLKILKFLPMYKAGKHTKNSNVIMKKGKSIEINGNNKFHVNIDGDIIGQKNLNIKIIPNAINIIFPNKK